jgi:hypothetical protein
MIRKTWTWLLTPPLEGPPVTAAIRLMAGSVFFWEGLLKFVYENQGVGRFTKLGFPFPLFTATFVGWLEIGGGLLLMLGLGTRLIAIPVRRRDARRDAVDEAAALPRHLAASPAPGPAADGHVGRAPRDPLGVGAAHELCLPGDRRPGPVVARRGAGLAARGPSRSAASRRRATLRPAGIARAVGQ